MNWRKKRQVPHITEYNGTSLPGQTVLTRERENSAAFCFADSCQLLFCGSFHLLFDYKLTMLQNKCCHIVPIRFTLALLACLPGLAMATCVEVCPTQWSNQIVPSMIIGALGLILTIFLVRKDGAEKSCSPTLPGQKPACYYRLRTLYLIAVAVACKLVLTLCGLDAAWGDALLAFNSVLAGVYASRGWLAVPNQPPVAQQEVSK
jgi:hypothetical protein